MKIGENTNIGGNINIIGNSLIHGNSDYLIPFRIAFEDYSSPHTRGI
jgi:hypothetical protein